MIIGYIDPGTGSMLISASVAMISVAFFMVKGFIYRKFSLGGDKGETLDPNKTYGLVFYSEGKQYWNVFKPLLEETSKRKIEATYMTSDKNDPGLNAKIEGITALYIGSGKESFFVLNRLRADLVVLTTPGLDVLEIKRSKHVKHYSHIVHAPGCIGGYKAFSVDYYDSVMLAGDGDISVIRELESKRNQKEKQIEVVGQSYLDELRKKVETLKIETPFFTNDRKTLLISPTWSNHGLLMKYGENIIQILLDANAYNIIIRPHPQSFISEKDMIEKLMKKFPAQENLVWDGGVENLIAMSQADIMISDFSGIIFDYFLLFKRPILTLNEHYEKRGRDVIDLDDDPWDVKMLSVIGKTITGPEIEKLPSIIEGTLSSDFNATVLDEKTINTLDKYPNEAAVRGIDFLEKVMKDLGTSPIHSETSVKNENTNINEKSFNKLNVLIQMLLAGVLLNTYLYVGTLLFPDRGLNKNFFIKMLPYSFMVTGFIFLLVLVYTWKNQKGMFKYYNTKDRFNVADFIFIMLPMTPILQYVLSNQDIMKLDDSITVLLLFTVLSILVVNLVPFVLSPIVSKKYSVSISVPLLFVVFNMASFGRTLNTKYIAIILAVLCIVFWLLQYFNKKKMLIGLIVILFISNTASAVVKGFGSIDAYGSLSKDGGLRFTDVTKDLTAQKKPDIYLLTYDSYGNEETMKLYGWDNSEQTDYLLNNGFAIYDGTYTTGLYSLSSIGKLLSPEPRFYNLKSLRTIVSGKSAGFIELEGLGYNTSIISQNDYMLKGVGSDYDFTYPEAKSAIKPSKIIIDAVIEGEFSSDAEFSKITYNDYLSVNNDLLSEKHDGPRFIYKHGSRPGHTPNVGSVQPDALDRYKSRLKDANEEMKRDIEIIRSHDKEAIIVVLGDHGPYLTKDGKDLSKHDPLTVDRLDVQDRFGTFLAISWPEDDYYNRYDIETIQDLFPSFLSYLYQDDSLFEKTRMPRLTTSKTAMSGLYVKDGIIHGGKDDGKPLFEIKGIRKK